MRYCSMCYEYGHNKRTCFKHYLPFFYIKNKTLNKDKDMIVKEINIDHIDLFYNTSNRSTSDEFNKKREEILCKLGNKEISEEWIQNDERWNNITMKLDEKINELKPENSTHYKFIPKGGRKFNYDFEIHFYKDNILLKLCKIEFKYGVNEISGCLWKSTISEDP